MLICTYIYIYIYVSMYAKLNEIGKVIHELKQCFPFSLGWSAVYLTKISTYQYNVANPGMLGKLPFDSYYLGLPH